MEDFGSSSMHNITFVHSLFRVLSLRWLERSCNHFCVDLMIYLPPSHIIMEGPPAAKQPQSIKTPPPYFRTGLRDFLLMQSLFYLLPDTQTVCMTVEVKDKLDFGGIFCSWKHQLFQTFKMKYYYDSDRV